MILKSFHGKLFQHKFLFLENIYEGMFTVWRNLFENNASYADECSKFF
jgi:hypothetical protein